MLLGGSGSDVLLGGIGNDALIGDAPYPDILIGNSGNNVSLDVCFSSQSVQPQSFLVRQLACDRHFRNVQGRFFSVFHSEHEWMKVCWQSYR